MIFSTLNLRFLKLFLLIINTKILFDVHSCKIKKKMPFTAGFTATFTIAITAVNGKLPSHRRNPNAHSCKINKLYPALYIEEPWL